jgi:hypothetical protein
VLFRPGAGDRRKVTRSNKVWTITDGVMPEMGGAKLAGESEPKRPSMKVLFVLAMRKAILRHGAIDMTTRFRQKPFALKHRPAIGDLDSGVSAFAASALSS